MTTLLLILSQVGLMNFILRVASGRAFPNLTLSILMVLSIYGLLSFSIALGGKGATVFHLVNATTIVIIALSAICAYFYARYQETKIVLNLPTVSSRIKIFILIVLVSFALGVSNFGVEFTPSSMTGDPPRHFARVLQFQFENATELWKPIYPLAAAVWLQMTPLFDPIQSFMVFNTLVLGGIGLMLCWTIALTRLPFSSGGPFCVACIAMAGYPQFALQYGYFALNLAALFFFATLAALLVWADGKNPVIYVLSMVLGAGVVLTHGYLMPPLVIIQTVVYLQTKSLCDHRSQENGRSPKWGWLIASIVWYVALSSISNGWTSIERLEGQFDTLKLRGLVNESFFLNITPFLPLTALALLIRNRPPQERLLTNCIVVLLFYSILLFVLGLLGVLAPYYTNRIQIVLLPLLVLSNAMVIHYFSNAFRFNPNIVFIVILIALLSLYYFYRNAPLRFADESFLHLLRRDESVYIENPTNAGYSPLQFTSFDVRLLKQLRKDYRTCFDEPLTNVATLGTDHSVQWIEHVAGIRPSLHERVDGYIDIAGYLRNFNIWNESSKHKYIVITSHFDFWNREDLIRKILASSSLVCAGDTIKIYRKNVRQIAAAE